MKTVETALAILSRLAEQPGERGVSELGRELDLDKASVSRHLNTLTRAGLVERDPESRRFRAGLALVEMAGAVLGDLPLVDVARPLMSQLWQETGESVQLSILRGLRGAMYVHILESPQGVRYTSRLGDHGPLHCSGAGKALLAYLPEACAARVLAQPLPRHTDHTVTDAPALREELAAIRARGYAIDDRGFREHLKSVAAPVLSGEGLPVAALGIGGPARRLGSRRTQALAESAVIAAQQIGRELRGRRQPPAVLP